MKAKTVLIDFPWAFKPYSESGDVKLPDYDVMDWNDGFDLPMKKVTEKNSAMFMWAVWSMLFQTQPLAKHWGFNYSTCVFTWIKLTKKGDAYARGTGYTVQMNTEPLLLFRRGKPKVKRRNLSQLVFDDSTVPLFGLLDEAIIHNMGEHSEKPAMFHDLIEELYDPPFLELFARQVKYKNGKPRQGWTFLGNEVDGLDIRESMNRYARLETIQPTVKGIT